MRYVAVKPARQSSAGSVTYVSADCGTGLLRRYTSYVSQAYRGFAMTNSLAFHVLNTAA
ncbi:MAG: hypothetical protein LBM98_02490 [Oscillospiraceae bacterium]|nr:hypothetical protein [Oscillospiraceae bacterium]